MKSLISPGIELLVWTGWGVLDDVWTTIGKGFHSSLLQEGCGSIPIHQRTKMMMWLMRRWMLMTATKQGEGGTDQWGEGRRGGRGGGRSVFPYYHSPPTIPRRAQ